MFSIVATPIGNLEDITLRAVRVLKEADMVLCEDTRVTRKLLAQYGIKTPTESYHARSTRGKTKKILDMLREGKNIALVTDSGTPGISDPGTELVARAREELPEVPIVAVPGASALVAALSIAGLRSGEFLFLGFLPHKKGRETLFKEIAASRRTVVFYESPHRIMKALERLAQIAPSRPIAVAKELTKIHERIVSGTAAEILAFFKQNPDAVRGEFVVIIATG